MNRMSLTSRFCCVALSLVSLSTMALAGSSLAPHRAFYTLEAARLDSKGGVTSISGKLAYEITGSDCDGYAISYRFGSRYTQGEGEPQLFDLRMTSYETSDGKEMNMEQKQFMNARLDKETKLKAKLLPNAPGEANFDGTEASKVTFDATAIFPTAFQKKLMDDALKGNTHTTAVVFDGTENEKASRAVGFIGAKKQDSHIVSGADTATLDGLNKLAYWPVTVSYFDLDAKADGEPNYTASFKMLENGVSTDLVMDYGTYALKGKLEKIEMLKTETCN
jgi:hypothetical protein